MIELSLWILDIRVRSNLKFITDKVRYMHNTDFVYNGQKTLVPTGTFYARFSVKRFSWTSIRIFATQCELL